MKPVSSTHRIAIVGVLIFCFFSVACTNRKKALDSVSLDADQLPMVHSEHVSSLISDSGITRYRLVAEIWDVYSQPNKSYWYFPEGFYVEKFDSLFNVEGNIESDTAYYYDKKQLWHLIGNVRVMNLQKEKFETDELFWNEKTQRIYSSKPIKIEQIDKVIYGEGFESNQTMSNYNIFKTNAIIYVDESKKTMPVDSVQTP